MYEWILTFLSIYLGYKIYKVVKCPPELKDIPSLDVFTILKTGMSKNSFDDEIAKHAGPMLDRYGTVRYFSHNGWSVMTADPQVTKLVNNNPDIFQRNIKSALNSNPHGLRFFGKERINNLNGEKWKRIRKLMNPIFHQTWPIETFSNCTREVIDNWSLTDGKLVDIHDNIQKLTLDILGLVVFNMDFESVKNPNSKLYNTYNDISMELFGNLIYLFFPILDKLPYLRRPKLQTSVNDYDEFVMNMVVKKREELESNSKLKSQDLLSMLVQASQEDGTPMLSNEEIRDNLKAFFIAGHDTTSNTLTATLYYLARHTEVQDKLRAEIIRVMNNPQILTNPTLDELKQMEYLNMVIKESMRAMTTASVLERITTSPFQLTNSIYLPAKTPVFLFLWQVHQQSKYFPNPKIFDPERFRDPASVESKNWQPFITGPRACIGITLSLMEQRVIIVLLLQKFYFSMQPDNPDYDKLRLNSNGIIRPKDLHLDLAPRI